MRKQGKVKFFDDTRGFGFLTGDDGVDVFVHRTGIAPAGSGQPTRRTLADGQRVEFELAHDERGARAIHVTVAP